MWVYTTKSNMIYEQACPCVLFLKAVIEVELKSLSLELDNTEFESHSHLIWVAWKFVSLNIGIYNWENKNDTYFMYTYKTLCVEC